MVMSTCPNGSSRMGREEGVACLEKGPTERASAWGGRGSLAKLDQQVVEGGRGVRGPMATPARNVACGRLHEDPPLILSARLNPYN